MIDSKTPDAGGTPSGKIARLWRWFWSPTARWSLGAIAITCFGAGVIFWGGFNTALDLADRQEFCISCHEMRDNVYQELRGTIHDSNRTGVRAGCADCHVPHEWIWKVQRKIQATLHELPGKVLGTIDTPEKFAAKRLELATNEWRRLKTTDSRECRNCHNFKHMDYSVQAKAAAETHQAAFAAGKTCIDCHKGIAHQLPDHAQEAGQVLDDELAGKGEGIAAYLKALKEKEQPAK
ncbi:periplasmic nitrate reductase subunit NapC [Rhodoblastus acidophilus]|uniref:Cytochrome c-type protein n=1 Tax=Rhodoblastus acidophilus TaxID=1074 RepID=A0A212PVX6_RHOAC|nr:NapC/NirT family cytochrome c [Rhodoblastus acidophilus]PPQ37844.1 cytochrome c-type protein NapC [Rhodoblastus acidophilus]RAI17116.1 cytochrome c-type protein NapC [Rhodoblastus acidophilus]SNB51048.1 periplasmic nitrate reductase subunit NapC [Rhodoblastus acidophilus]